MTNVAHTLAVKGYDVVAYFDGTPTLGDAVLKAEFDGSTYYFSSEENKAKFEANPQQYVPAFGGYCALAMSEDNIMDVDPRNFKIVDGRLLLFYKGVAGDTLVGWEQGNEAELLAKADENWKTRA